MARPQELPRSPIPGESEGERWRRNFSDLLQELRVAQTGVQILFAFLLSLVFTNRFPQLNAFQRDVYVVALISAAFATAMIIAPVAYHRMLFRLGRKPELVRSGHRMATGGLTCLLVAMVSSVLLVTDFILSTAAAFAITAITGAWFVLLWGVLPYLRRRDDDDDGDPYEEATRYPAGE